jgi:hypothetical protein
MNRTLVVAATLALAFPAAAASQKDEVSKPLDRKSVV